MIKKEILILNMEQVGFFAFELDPLEKKDERVPTNKSSEFSNAVFFFWK